MDVFPIQVEKNEVGNDDKNAEKLKI